jgi:RHS repeat-associated protein
VVGGTTTYYVYKGGQVIAEYNGSGGLLTEYIYTGSRMVAKISSAVTRYYLNDRLSVRLALDASGNIVGRQGHLPFGEDFGESGEQEKRHFTSYERDAESGLDYAINRSYSPSIGRFQSADPYRASGYRVDPQSWNRYAYTRNNPVNRIDPAGLEDDTLHPIEWDNGTISVNAGAYIVVGVSELGGGDEMLREENIHDEFLTKGPGETFEPLPPIQLSPLPNDSDFTQGIERGIECWCYEQHQPLTNPCY